MPAAARTCVSGANFSQVDESSLKIPLRRDAPEVPAVAVRAHDILAFAQSLVREHVDRGVARSDRAALGAEDLADLLLFGQPEVGPELCQELLLVQPVVAPDERE